MQFGTPSALQSSDCLWQTRQQGDTLVRGMKEEMIEGDGQSSESDWILRRAGHGVASRPSCQTQFLKIV